MKIGAFSYATVQGLGLLMKSFYDHGVITDPFILVHHCRPSHFEWYPADTPRTSSLPSPQLIEWVRSLDIFLVFETPFDWELIRIAHNAGVKVVFVPMYECTPVNVPYAQLIDRWICPSLLDYQHFPMVVGRDSQHIPIPVEVPWKERKLARTFVHNAGNGGLLGRNGTKELVESLKFIRSPAEILIRSQEHYDWVDQECGKLSYHLDVHYGSGTIKEEYLYDGDVFVFPEKFNGLSLPLQEAYASGMAIIAPYRFPNYTYLPLEMLLPVAGYRKNRVGPSYREFDEAIVDPIEIAKAIDTAYGKDINHLSLRGKYWAEENSWEVLKPRWMEALR